MEKPGTKLTANEEGGQDNQRFTRPPEAGLPPEDGISSRSWAKSYQKIQTTSGSSDLLQHSLEVQEVCWGPSTDGTQHGETGLPCAPCTRPAVPSHAVSWLLIRLQASQMPFLSGG